MKTHTALRRALVIALAALAGALVVGSAQAATYRLGDCGAGVASLQRKLERAHYPAGGVDGCFGRATRFGVLAFQLAQRLTPDGVAGPVTLARLEAPRPVFARRTRSGRHVEVDRARQIFLVVRDGTVAAIYAASTGKAGYRTPAGAFHVYRKEVNGWSYQYDVPLHWVSYFHYGYAVHAGKIPGYPASHGCVRVPPTFAPRIYRQMPIGSFVLID